MPLLNVTIMYKAKIFNGHWLEKRKLWFHKPINIYNSLASNPDENKINVLNLCGEPETSRGASNKKVLEFGKKYNLIISWDEEILSKCDNAKFMPFGTTWIKRKDWGLKPKNFGVTTLCSSKKNTLNHKKRHALWNRQNEHVFWNSSQKKLLDIDNNPVLGGQTFNKIKMMNSQFHIAIENVYENNYFSEKLIDCLITGTIPIYCGCTNLEKYFDTRGIIQAQTVDDIIKTCNSLTPSLYEDLKDYIKVNFHLAHEYANNFSSRLHSMIQQHLMG